ncbi:metallopeptidase TldD-related protein [Hoyosella sp. YIM 151337]|uniref:metallopeptidase TldD-related protein n=1 Tax=Hoyosella sp. YIM 151337 TaxID=2992742 RepID=UPI002235F46B|nr:metallopeptidase TldD-related protein [Hoyosella sp. YIM 151337]MCW4353017.1 metallopeptidase TldD-related protein [Hoyosella sp. YIM 151337]
MIPAADLVGQCLAIATADQTIVIVTDVSEASLRWANSSMTTNGSSMYRRWSVLSFVDKPEGTSVGVVNSQSADAGDIPAVVRASESAARESAPARDAMPLLAGHDEAPDWTAPAERTAIDVFSSFTPDLAQAFSHTDQLYGFAHHEVQTTWLGSSTGLRKRWVQPVGSVEINGKREYRSHTASAWTGAGTRTFGDVDMPGMLADLDTRLRWGAEQRELPAGRYETILPPSAISDLLIYMMWSMEGRGAEEGHNAFARSGGGTRIGERLTTLPLNLVSDPGTRGLEYAPFVAATSSSDLVSVFDNGMPAQRVEWLRDGVLSALAYPRANAHEFNSTPTVPGENLILDGGSAATVEDMVRNTERGLLLTCLWYIREVDPSSLLLTGLTRDGVYLIEDGTVTAAVNNFRFNESPIDLLRRISEAGSTRRTLPREWKDWFTLTAMPPVRVPDFHMSSVSQAT